MPINSGNYVIYLRKSRADVEAEQRGEGETLARHERELLALAARLHLPVTDIYREVVSGETIAARPKMQQLLSEVDDGLWDGVLVMEVERLARGDTIDQGIVSQAFHFSNTKIITPAKTYDPNNESDEEYFEFGLFMSRREYKTINRRLQRGRVASIKEGKYPHSVAPFGYDRKKLEHDKGFTLVPNPDEAQIVRMIYELYTVGMPQSDGTCRRYGLHKIASHLNDIGLKTKYGKIWTETGVRDIMRNPVYIGKLWWYKRRPEKTRVDGVVKTRYIRDYSKAEYYDGIHKPIISEETYRLAQEYMDNTPAVPVSDSKETQNPLCGLVICGKCGKKMQRRKHFKKGVVPGIVCAYASCDNVGADLRLVESRVIESLREWLASYKLTWDEPTEKSTAELEVRRKALKKLETDIGKLELQQSNLHDLLEQGVYDTDTFLSRNRNISERLNQALTDRDALQRSLDEDEQRRQSRIQIVPKVEHLLDVYDTLPSPASKNEMLKEVIDRIVYVKEVENRRKHEDAFTIDLYPKLPQSPPTD